MQTHFILQSNPNADLCQAFFSLRALLLPAILCFCQTRFMVLHFLIRGRVQGVGFRWFVHREASELNLRGWVRNTEEGDVEVVAAGEPEDISDLRVSLRRGSRGSRVDNILEHTLDESEAASLDAFRIQGAW
jgi:acylphosphatase